MTQPVPPAEPPEPDTEPQPDLMSPPPDQADPAPADPGPVPVPADVPVVITPAEPVASAEPEPEPEPPTAVPADPAGQPAGAVADDGEGGETVSEPADDGEPEDSQVADVFGQPFPTQPAGAAMEAGNPSLVQELRVGGGTSNESPALPATQAAGAARAHALAGLALAAAADDSLESGERMAKMRQILEFIRAELDRYVPEQLRMAAGVEAGKILSGL
jgi:hypothetical protein